MARPIVVLSCTMLLLIAAALYSATTGSLKIGLLELAQSIFGGFSEQGQIVKDLRFPRIIVSMLAGAALSVSGALLQAVMKNPLAEPGIIGVSSGAGLVSLT